MHDECHGVKCYNVSDLAFGINYESAVEVLEHFDYTKQFNDTDDINEVIELYNVYKIIFSEGIKEEYVLEYKNKAKKLLRVVAVYFKTINDDNFLELYRSVRRLYLQDFWELFCKFHVYKNISETKFTELLHESEEALYLILLYRDIVNYYDSALVDFMSSWDKTAEIIISKYLKRKDHNSNYYIPSLSKEDYEFIFLKYINSDNSNISLVQLVAESQSTNDCPISVNLRYLAKKKYEAFWNEQKSLGTGTFYEVAVSIADIPDLISKEINGSCGFKLTFDRKWIDDNLDYPTLLNNFIYLFGFVDMFGRCTLSSVSSQMGVLEREIGVKGIKEYDSGIYFENMDIVSSLMIKAYYNELYHHGIRIEDVIQWFFSEYLQQEFCIDGFVFNAPSQGSTILEKCKTLPSEMDGIFKQYKMYVEDNVINRELLEMSSNPISIRGIPSLLNSKYVYLNSEEVKNEVLLLFSDQCMLKYLPKYGEKFRCFYDLILNKSVKKQDYSGREIKQLEWLVKRGTIIIDDDGTIIVNKARAFILKDLYEHDVTCPLYYHDEIKKELSKMVDKGDVLIEASLLSRPEQHYFNFMLNKSEFSNGKDLRNKYIHSTYPIDERIQESDYYSMLKLMVIVVIKINEELCLRDRDCN